MANINKKRLLVISGSLILLAGALYGYAAYTNYDNSQGDLARTASRLEDARRLAKERGLVLEIDDLMTEQRLQGIEGLSEFDDLDQILADNRSLNNALMQDHKRHLLASELASAPEALEALYHAASIDSVSFPVEWEQGLLAPSFEHGVVNRLVTLATASALIAYEQGDQDEAWRRLSAGVRIMNQLHDEPAYKSVGGWTSSASRLIKAVYEIVESDPSNARTTRSAIDLIAEIGEPPSIESILPGEVLKYLVTARNFNAYDEYQVASLTGFSGDTTEVPYSEDRPKAYEAAALEFWVGAIDEMKPLDNEIEKGILLDHLGMEWATDEHASQFLSGAFPATYEQLGKQIARSKQMKRLLHTVCTIVQEWQKTGVLPKKLKSNGSANDPVSRKPFHYTRLENGFALQALGRQSPESAMPARGDFVWVHEQGYGLEFALSGIHNTVK